MANLPKAGVEYFTWKFSGLPDGAEVEVQIGSDWYPLTVDGQEGKILLAGPDAPETEDAVTVSESDKEVTLRVTDSPEVIIRNRGEIILV